MQPDRETNTDSIKEDPNMMLTASYILTHTPSDIAAHFSAQEIASTYYVDEDTIVDFIGDGDPTDWDDKTGSDMTEMVDEALSNWYDREREDRPDEYSTEDMGLSLVLYRAWQIAYENEED